jgi:hypothetical protein
MKPDLQLPTLDINDVEAVDAFFDAILARMPAEKIADYLRQRRSELEIKADNEAAQADATNPDNWGSNK